MTSFKQRMTRRLLRRYARDESGVATIFACFMIMMMVLVGGIGVDLMHNEMERTRMQNTLDRAVLAAADLDQTLDPEAVVRDYFAKAGMSEFLADVTVSQGLNFRTVSARASTVSQTQFMHLMGVDELKVPALGTAEERISNVEVSLVLDVSGSMAWNSKMSNMQDAAHEFIANLIRPETDDLISINVVPYSEHVNLGAALYNQIPFRTNRHSYSYCLEMPDSEFSSAALNLSLIYDQMQHFQWNYDGYSNDRANTVCPRNRWGGVDNSEFVIPFSQDADAILAHIDNMKPRAGTSIFMGVKWGAALLDPSTRGIVSNLANAGVIDSVFSGRPANYDDAETLKTIVVMTDGKNDRSNRIVNGAYRTSSHYVHWNNYNFWWYLRNYVSSSQHGLYYYEKYNAALGDTLTHNICTAAKQAGIVIWGVGFEVDDHGANVLKNCASSPSHFFRVEGVEISEAFEAIASQINQLRLTQ